MEYRFFTTSLLAWHQRENIRKMPWKGEKNPYKIWLSEIILQQTRVEQGLKYYEDFVRSFPDIASLATAQEEVVYKKWEGLGYYSRCKNLIATAKYLHEHCNGIFPHQYHELLALKGIGPYTAAAIISFAYNQPYAVVDGNVKRVISRFFAVDIPVDTIEGHKALHELASGVLSKKSPAIYNQAIMDFGATVCKPARPDCVNCPLKKKCKAYGAGTVDRLPVKKNRTKLRHRYFNYFLITTGNEVYLKKRGGSDIWENLYEPVLIESAELLTNAEIKKLKPFAKHFEKGFFLVTEVSNGYAQRLTHQKINGQFIRIESKLPAATILGSKPVPMQRLNDFAFPKIVANYLKDNAISLNLNF